MLLVFERPDYDNPTANPKWKVSAYDPEAYKFFKDDETKQNAVLSNTAGEAAKIPLTVEAAKAAKGSSEVAAADNSITITFSTDGTLDKAVQEKLKKVKFHMGQVNFNEKDKKFTKDESVATYDTTIDFSALTGFAGVNNAQRQTMDGNAAGTLTGFGVEADGTIRGTFSNGDTRALAKIATASFSNPLGLEKAGASYFVESGNSGQPQIGEPGSGTRGAMTGGAIEMSNVDLAAEFTNLILSQRGFQANTRVITTSDEILQELVSMKR